MTIQNLKKTSDYISNWVKNYAEKAGIKTLIIGLSGGVDSALVALLCKQTRMPLLCVNMPCHSSDTAFNRASAFAADFDLPLVKVDLSLAHEHIYGQVSQAKLPGVEHDKQLAVGGLRSCLRAPTLSFFANATNGLIVGTGNRSEDNLTRYYQKYGDGCVDISCISDLFKSEVYELFAYLSAEMAIANGVNSVSSKHIDDKKIIARELMIDGKFRTLPKSAWDIYDAKPTADLWGPDSGQEDEKELGISYDEIEWADREETRTFGKTNRVNKFGEQFWAGIVTDSYDPAKHPAWLGYTGRQRVVIARIHALEKASRHKVNPNLPVCHIRDVNGLVK